MGLIGEQADDARHEPHQRGPLHRVNLRQESQLRYHQVTAFQKGTDRTRIAT